MRDDAHRSIFDELGVNSQTHVAVLGPQDEAFVRALEERLAKGASQWLRTHYDLIVLKIDAPADLALIAGAAIHLRVDGALWVFHPKGRAAIPSASAVRTQAHAAGLIENKRSAYSDSHAATRFVAAAAV